MLSARHSVSAGKKETMEHRELSPATEDDSEWRNRKHCPVAVDGTPGSKIIASTETWQSNSKSNSENNINTQNNMGNENASTLNPSFQPSWIQGSSGPTTEIIDEAELPGDNNRHYFDPSDRRLGMAAEAKAATGADGNENHSSLFLKTQVLFFGSTTSNNQIYNSDNNNSTRFVRKTQAIVEEGQRFGHSKRLHWSSSSIINDSNSADYRMGLISSAICVSVVVLGWLALLAIVWKMGSNKARRRKGGCLARNNYNNNTTSETKPTGSESHEGTTNDEDDEIENEKERAIVMKCSFAASPRWLSFPENRDITLDSVTSFYTNTSLASLASSSVPDNGNDEKRSSGIRNNNSNGHNSSSHQEPGTTTTSGSGKSKSRISQFYKVGIVRDGRVDVSSADSLAASGVATTDPEGYGESTTHRGKSSQNLPWNEILGGLYTDLVACDENLNNFSFGSNSLFSGYTSAIDISSKRSSKNSRSVLSRQTSAIDSMHSLDSNGQFTRSGSAPAAAVAANEDEILRDLEQLEQQVNHQHQTQASEDGGRNQSGELRDLRELELQARIATGLHQVQQGDGGVSDASMISSLLTTAMQRKNQEGLLCEEGVEIWYDTETQTFFRNESNHQNGSNNKSSSRPYNKTPSRSSWQRNLWGRSFRSYCSTASPSADLITDSYLRSVEAHYIPPPTVDPTDIGKADTSKAQHPLGSFRKHFWRRFGRVAFFAAGVGIVVSSFSMAIFGANILYEASTKTSAVLGETQKLALEGSGIFDSFLGSSTSSSFLARISDVAPFSSNNNTTTGETSNTSNISSTHVDGVLYGVFEDLTKRLFQSTNAACDFGNRSIADNSNDNDLLLQEALENIVGLWNEHLVVPLTGENKYEIDGVGSSKGMVLHKLEGIQNDLSRVSDDVASFEESWIGPYDSIVLVLRVSNAMLGTACLLLLVGVATHRLENRTYRRILLPLFVTLVVLSMVASLFFLVGSTVLEDFCGEEDPDEQVLEFLSSAKQREQSVYGGPDLGEKVDRNREVWSDLSYDMAEGYIQQCPSGGTEGIPKEAATLVELGWEFARALWEVSKLLMDTETCTSFVEDDDVTPILDGSSSGSGSVLEVAEIVMQTSCEFSVLLNDFVDMLRCDNWYRLYEEGIHDAVCDLGRTGFLWVAITQSIIVAMSLVMLTIRIIERCLDSNSNNNPKDNNLSATREDETNEQRDTTMLIEDEEDYDCEELEAKEAPFPTLTSDNASGFFDALAFDNDCPFVEEPNQIATVAPPQHHYSEGLQQQQQQDPHARSSKRILRRNRQRERKPSNNNFLASTSLYAIGTSSVEDESDDSSPNVEVCLYSPNKILTRYEDEEEQRWFGYNWHTSIRTGDDNGFGDHQCEGGPQEAAKRKQKPQAQRSRSRSKSRSSGTTASSSSLSGCASSFDDFSGEVDRVRERLRNIQERKGRLSEKKQRQQQLQQRAPKVQVTVTTQ